MIRWMLRIVVALLLVALIGLGVWWFTRPPEPISTQIARGEERSRKLLALAAADAARIEEVDPRLTRMLNLADAQISSGWEKDAVQSLRLASATLASEDAAKLSSHARISGWISVSELSRVAGDSDGAVVACDSAVSAVRNIEDPAVRCRYVIGVANQLQYLRGKDAAADMVAESGDWTKAIDDLHRRRETARGFAAALFNLDDFDRGAELLAADSDAAWRSQTLFELSQQAQRGGVLLAKRSALAPAEEAPMPAALPVSFDEVFRGQARSQTSPDPKDRRNEEVD